jgi:hypothetical protein
MNHFSYSALSFHNFVSHFSHSKFSLFCYSELSYFMILSVILEILSAIFATVLSYFMTLSAILEILPVILVQWSSILQNSSVVLKILSAILSNDYRGFTGERRLAARSRGAGRVHGLCEGALGCAARSRGRERAR